jgi:hypothetical protein
MWKVSYCYFWIFLEDKLVETFIAILGDIFYCFIEFWHGQNPNSPLSPWICSVKMVHLLFWDFDIFSCGVLHQLGNLHIHPWSWLPWNSHIWSGCMHAHSSRAHSMWTLGI